MPEFEIAAERTVVLIVEDEPIIRFATLDALEGVGHEALEAGNADEAMVIFRMRQDIDIVFTDVNMAGSMDGIQFANRVRAIRPSIGIIITSGLVRLDPMSLPANTVFLPKPYRHEELLESISLLTS
ncbi:MULTISPECIES: response regulator [unclassified Sinorhizobium]|uniref:response regulator n=1 Tax=unclassified Sinorhizobium TaxID=2613772 RepID=UPI00352411A5